MKEQEDLEEAFWNTHKQSLSGLKDYKLRYPNGKHIHEIASIQSAVVQQEEQNKKQKERTKTVIEFIGGALCVAILIGAIKSGKPITLSLFIPATGLTYTLEKILL